MNIVLLGPPAAGKGTVGRRVAEQFGLFYFSTGDLFREMVKKGDAYALFVKEQYIDKGGLFPEHIAFEFIQRHMSSQGNVFDGAPRTIGQAQYFDEHIPVDSILFLELLKEKAIERMNARQTCRNCNKSFGLSVVPPAAGNCDCGGELYKRKEDSCGTARYDEYLKMTGPVVEYYRGRNNFQLVNSDRPLEIVLSDIFTHLSQVRT